MIEVHGRLTDEQEGPFLEAIGARFSLLVAAHQFDEAIQLFRATGALGLRIAIPYSRIPDLPTTGTGAPWRISDVGLVALFTEDDSLVPIGHVWTPELDAGRFNFSCLHTCPANLITYQRRIEAAAALEDHWRHCPANHTT